MKFIKNFIFIFLNLKKKGHSHDKQIVSEDDEGYENEDDESANITLQKALQVNNLINLNLIENIG